MPRWPKRSVVISVRVTPDEEIDLKRFARAHDMPLGMLIRQALKDLQRRAEKKAS